MAQDRLGAVGDAVVTRLQDQLELAEPNTIERVDLEEVDVKTLEGQKVYVIAHSWNRLGKITRDKNREAWVVMAIVVVPYRDKGIPPTEWIDEQAALAEAVFEAMDVDAQADWILGTCWTETITVPDRCSAEQIQSNGYYIAEITATYNEIR